MTTPTPPIELTGTESRWGPGVDVPGAVIERLRGVCEVVTDDETTAEASRDWWPLALPWSLAGLVPRRAAAVGSPTTVEQVTAFLRIANEAGIPVTPVAGRSGVVGGAATVFGGVALDLTGLAGVVNVDETSGVVEVFAGTFGPDLERALEPHGLSVRHFPQSFDLATVGGWVACRGAGQFSTRYGKIEDMVVGLEVVTADGSVIRTGGFPAGATGPDLTQLFVGSEGTLGVITRVWLRAHRLPPHEARAAYWLPSMADAIDVCRRVIQAGATPAVLRLYDAIESARSHQGNGRECLLLVVDEGDERIVSATMAVVDDAVVGGPAGTTGRPADVALVDAWFQHRNDTTALQALSRRGIVVDTMEIAAPWSRLVEIYDATTAALLAVPHALAASAHLSHSYPDGACLYFSFAARPPGYGDPATGNTESGGTASGELDALEASYVTLWDAGQRAALAHGGNVSHHHGIGISRGRFLAEALGPAFDVLVAMKQALDPNGVLNPGKLGLPSPFGPAPWPRPESGAASADPAGTTS